jgi:hypothetical protein
MGKVRAVLAIHVSGYRNDMSIEIGTTVTWRAASGEVEGTVTAVHPRPVVRRINGVRITRLGSPEDPAYEIEQDDGTRTLKLASEVQPRAV